MVNPKGSRPFDSARCETNSTRSTCNMNHFLDSDIIFEGLYPMVRRRESILRGRHLMEFGLKPSPKLREIIQKSFEAQESGEFSDLEGAKKWLADNIDTLTMEKGGIVVDGIRVPDEIDILLKEQAELDRE